MLSQYVHSFGQMGVEQGLAADKVDAAETLADCGAEVRGSAFELFDWFKLAWRQRAVVGTAFAVQVAIIAENKLEAHAVGPMGTHR